MQLPLFRTGIRSGLENLQQSGKKVKTKSQKDFRVNFYAWRS